MDRYRRTAGPRQPQRASPHGTPRHLASAKCKPRKHAMLCGPLKQPRGPRSRHRPLRRRSSTTSRTMANRFPSPNMRHTSVEARYGRGSRKTLWLRRRAAGAEGGHGDSLGAGYARASGKPGDSFCDQLVRGTRQPTSRTRTMTGEIYEAVEAAQPIAGEPHRVSARDCRHASNAPTHYGSISESHPIPTAQHL